MARQTTKMKQNKSGFSFKPLKEAKRLIELTSTIAVASARLLASLAATSVAVASARLLASLAATSVAVASAMTAFSLWFFCWSSSWISSGCVRSCGYWHTRWFLGRLGTGKVGGTHSCGRPGRLASRQSNGRLGGHHPIIAASIAASSPLIVAVASSIAASSVGLLIPVAAAIADHCAR